MKTVFETREHDEDEDPTYGWMKFTGDTALGPYSYLQMCLRYNACCGLFELHDFRFSAVAPKENFTAFFETFVKKLGEDEDKGILHLTLTRFINKTSQTSQPQWFVDAIEAYPGAIHSEWEYNPNSGNYIQMWMLPTHRKKGRDRSFD